MVDLDPKMSDLKEIIHPIDVPEADKEISNEYIAGWENPTDYVRCLNWNVCSEKKKRIK